MYLKIILSILQILQILSKTNLVKEKCLVICKDSV